MGFGSVEIEEKKGQGFFPTRRRKGDRRKERRALIKDSK